MTYNFNTASGQSAQITDLAMFDVKDLVAVINNQNLILVDLTGFFSKFQPYTNSDISDIVTSGGTIKKIMGTGYKINGVYRKFLYAIEVVSGNQNLIKYEILSGKLVLIQSRNLGSGTVTDMDVNSRLISLGFGSNGNGLV
jgi:hypothetical protein